MNAKYCPCVLVKLGAAGSSEFDAIGCSEGKTHEKNMPYHVARSQYERGARKLTGKKSSVVGADLH